MYFINLLNKNKWWRLNKERMLIFNFFHGHQSISQEEIDNSEIIELGSWHELYCSKGFCPLCADKYEYAVWISPEGKFYKGDAHENRAKEILEIVYGKDKEEIYCAGDYLEKYGWVRAVNNMMWEIRFDELSKKEVTQAQYDALWDWCECNRKRFPDSIGIKI